MRHLLDPTLALRAAKTAATAEKSGAYVERRDLGSDFLLLNAPDAPDAESEVEP
jgi:hypothetical protein